VFDVKNIVTTTLAFRLGVTHPANLYCWNQQTRGCVYAADSMGLSSFTSTQWALEKAIYYY